MRRAREFIIAAAIAGLVVALIAALIVNRNASDRAALRRAVQRYVDAVQPLGVEGGRIVQQEIKPALTDLRAGEITPEVFRTRALVWLSSLRRIRTMFVTAAHPARLDEAAGLYGEAMDGYIAAVDAWIVATREPTQAERNGAIAEAASIAEEADDTYDRARAALTAEMERVGLDVQEL